MTPPILPQPPRFTEAERWAYRKSIAYANAADRLAQRLRAAADDVERLARPTGIHPKFIDAAGCVIHAVHRGEHTAALSRLVELAYEAQVAFDATFPAEETR